MSIIQNNQLNTLSICLLMYPFSFAVDKSSWLNTGWRCAGWGRCLDSSKATKLEEGERVISSSQTNRWSSLLPCSCISTRLAESWAIFSHKKIWNPVSMMVGWSTQKSGMKTFWKKYPPRKHSHISAAVYIIIILTALFLLFLPLVLILLLSCLLYKTEIDS